MFYIQKSPLEGCIHYSFAMRRKWRSNMAKDDRNMAEVLLDFVFGDPLPVPEVIEEDTAEVWQKWLNAVADSECVVEFEPTRPSRLN